MIVDGGQEQGKFVATEPGKGVALAQAFLEPVGHCLQQPISHRVAEGVVDDLETVKVQKHNRQLLATTVGVGDRQLKSVLEKCTVRQSR